MTKRDLSIVVLTWNRKDCLRELLDELRPLADGVREVIVVDNCSTDGTDAMLRDEYGWVHALRTAANVGVSARNLGIRTAAGRVVVTIDDDIMGLDEAALDHLERRFAGEPGLGALNFQVRDWFSRVTCNWVHHRPIEDAAATFETYEITEGAVAFLRDAVLAAAGYHEAYFISHEGPDLAFRLMNRGFAVGYDGGIVVFHKHEQRAREPWRFYYFDTRNQVWLAVRNMPWREGAAYLTRGLAAMLVYALRDGYFVWWAQGVRDGCWRLPEMIRGREVWSPGTRAACRRIDSHRLGFWTLAWRRLFQPANRLDG